MLRHAIWLPLFDGLADPRLAAQLASEAEEAGWDGVFVWDHIRWREPVEQAADTTVTLAAIASATQNVRLGPMVTPLARRRPTKLARETASLDQLSNGRLTLGVGLGGDRFGQELSKTGEEEDDRTRAQMLDEALEILTQAWTGELVQHQGKHYVVDGIRFKPTPVQRPAIPVWVAGFAGKRKPLQRAARFDGFFPVNLEHPDQLEEVVQHINTLRKDNTQPYDIAVELEPDADPAPYQAAGATWCLTAFDPEAIDVDRVRGVTREGPPRGKSPA